MATRRRVPREPGPDEQVQRVFTVWVTAPNRSIGKVVRDVNAAVHEAAAQTGKARVEVSHG